MADEYITKKSRLRVQRLAMQIPSAGGFRPQNVVEVLLGGVDKADILDHRRRVDHPTQRWHVTTDSEQDFRKLIRIGDVGGKFANINAVLPQPVERHGRIGCGRLAAADEGKVARTSADQPLGRGEAEAAAAASHQIAGVRRQIQPGLGHLDWCGSFGIGHRHDDLADVARLLHRPKRLDRPPDRVDAVRQRVERAALQQRRQILEELTREHRTIDQQPIDIDPEKLDVVAERAQPELAVRGKNRACRVR